MNCPRCDRYLKPEFPATIHTENFQEFNDVDFKCENGHTYFVRVRLDDLINADLPEDTIRHKPV